MAARPVPPAAFLETCQCGKRTHTSKTQAKRAARVLYPGARMRLYRCGGGWHMTSQDAGTTARRRTHVAWKAS